MAEGGEHFGLDATASTDLVFNVSLFDGRTVTGHNVQGVLLGSAGANWRQD